MVVNREKTASTGTAGYYKWVAGIVIIVVVSSMLISHRSLVTGLVGSGVSSGRHAKLAFRLHEGGNFAVDSVVWSPDGRYIATGSTYVREIHIWDVSSGRIIKRLLIPYPPPFFHQLAWSADGRFLAACDGTGRLRIYNTDTWILAHVFTELPQEGGCNHPAFSSDSKRVAVIGGSLTVYNVPDWRVLESVDLRGGWAKGDMFNAVGFVPNTYTVIVGGGQYIRDLRDGEKEPWDGRVWFFCAQSHGPCRSITVFRPAGGPAGGGPVWNLAVSPDGQSIVTATNTGTVAPGGTPIEPVHIVRLSDGTTVGAPLDDMRPFGRADGLAYTADNRYIIAAHDQADGAVHIVSGSSYQVVDLLHAGGFVYDMTVNRHDDEFAVGVSDKIIAWSLPAP